MANVSILLIHGVGPFPEAQVMADVRSLLSSRGISTKSVQAVNWRRVAGDLSGEEPAFLEQIAAISRGVQGVVNIERPASSLPLRSMRNLGLIVAIVAPTLLLPPVPMRFWRAACLVWLAVTILQLVYAVVKGGRTVSAALVTSLLPWLWIVGHAFVVLPYLTLRFVLGTMGCWSVVLITCVLVPLSFFLVPVACFSILLPPIVYYVTSHGIHLGVYEWFVPIWRRVIERSGAAMLLLAADVVRYLGDAPHRRRIQQQVIDAINSSRNAHLIIVAHSLGSVIAVDALCSFASASANNITLITMGSPLRRLMHRLLPNEYPAPAGIRASLLQAGVIDRWINIYRPVDMVGASLFRGFSGDYSTKEWIKGWLPPLHAHMNYWNDPKVLERVLLGVTTNPINEVVCPVEREPLVNGPILADSPALRYAALIVFASIAYARLVLWFIALASSDRHSGCVLSLIALGIFVLGIPITLRIVIPNVLSLVGVHDGGADWVSPLAMSKKTYEAEVLPHPRQRSAPAHGIGDRANPPPSAPADRSSPKSFGSE